MDCIAWEEEGEDHNTRKCRRREAHKCRQANKEGGGGDLWPNQLILEQVFINAITAGDSPAQCQHGRDQLGPHGNGLYVFASKRRQHIRRVLLVHVICFEINFDRKQFDCSNQKRIFFPIDQLIADSIHRLISPQ